MAEYSHSGFSLCLIAGPIRYKVLPAKVRDKPKKGKKKKPKPVEGEEEKPKGGSIADFKELLPEALRAGGRFIRGLIVNRLVVYYTAASTDPASAAIQYGLGWAAVGSIIPVIENTFNVKNRDVQVLLDYEEQKPAVYVCLNITIRIWRTLAIAFSLLARILGVYFKNKKRKA